MKLSVNGESVFSATAHRDFDPNLDTVVFIHGAGLDHTVWMGLERYAARSGRNVMALDLPGHGRSEGKPLTSITTMADWIIAVLDEQGIAQASLVGHSMGALVAFDCASRHPDRIEHSVLLGFACPMTVGPPLLEAARSNSSTAIDMMLIYGHDFRAQIGGNTIAGVRIMNVARRLLERNPPGVLFADLSACNDYDSGDAVAERMRVPVSLIAGDRDKMTPLAAARAIAERIPGATLHLVENCGHGLMAEQPERTQRILFAALDAREPAERTI